MIMFHEIADSAPQRVFTKEDHLLQATLFISCNDLIPMSSEVCSNEPPNRVLGLAGPLLQGRGLLGSEGAEARVGDCPGIGPAGVDPVDLGVHEPEVDRLLVTNLRGRVGGRSLRGMERTGDGGIGGRGGGPGWEGR